MGKSPRRQSGDKQTTAGVQINEKQATAKPAAKGNQPAQGNRSDAAYWQSLEEKALLEQSMARVTGGRTGLMLLLSAMIESAEKEQITSFQYYAQCFYSKSLQLEKDASRYTDLLKDLLRVQGPEQAAGGGELVEATSDLPLYQTLVKIGEALKQVLPPASILQKQMAEWLAQVQPLMKPYFC